MRKLLLMLTVVGIAFIPTTIANADQPDDIHCPGHNVAPNVKDESGADDNDLVVAAGTRICVKSGQNDDGDKNTGIVIADGEDTLQEILFDNGIVDGSGEQGRDVSYWVTYPPLLEAYVCFEGEIVTFDNEDQEALNLEVSAYLETHSGGVQVESSDEECEVPITTTTTTTIVVVDEPIVPVTPPAPQLLTAPAPVGAAPAAPAAPAPATTLPHTGSGMVLTLIGSGLTGAGLFIRRLFRRN
jgi:hypothetical protein